MNPVQKEENFQSCNTNRCVQVVNNGLESGHAAAGSQSRPWSTGQPGAPHTAVTRAENGTRTAGGGRAACQPRKGILALEEAQTAVLSGRTASARTDRAQGAGGSPFSRLPSNTAQQPEPGTAQRSSRIPP